MHLSSLIVAALTAVSLADDKPRLQIGVTKKVENCQRKARSGDFVAVHYAGRLEDGTEFDNSYKRGQPIEFSLGSRQVIEGWDKGIIGMCLGEKRRLTIPPHLAYGDRGTGPIPAKATLVFETELVGLNREYIDESGETVSDAEEADDEPLNIDL